MIRVPLSLKGKDTLQRQTAAQLVQVANQYESRIMIECEQKIVNAKSMLGLLSVGVDAANSPLTLLVDGLDEQEAAKALLELIKDSLT